MLHFFLFEKMMDVFFKDATSLILRESEIIFFKAASSFLKNARSYFVNKWWIIFFESKSDHPC